MKNVFTFFRILSGALIILAGNCNDNGGKMPFSFDEIRNTKSKPLPAHNVFRSSDGVDIAYYSYVPGKKPDAAVIFIHGGGAFSGAGYPVLAEKLRDRHGIAVYLMDLRGHGKSGGPRGDSPSVEQVWIDVKLFIQYIKSVNKDVPLFLAGHSSGAGLILNYLSWNRDESVKGYIFISPEFGYKSNTARKGRVEFAEVKTSVFIKNAMTHGKYGNEEAVVFNYPVEILKSQPEILRYITCNMAIALTPDDPSGQFGKIDKPFGLFVGRDDELFDPENVVSFGKRASKKIRNKSVVRVVEGEKHLSILRVADELIIEAIQKIKQ